MFPWTQPSSENCGCKIPTKLKSRSIFKKIASATGQWIADLLGVPSGQLIVRDGSTLGYFKPNCEGLVKVDTDGNASVGNIESLEGPAIGNPLGFGFLPYLELFDKEICDPDGGLPTEEQWMRIKALMPQWIATGEIAVMNKDDCASEMTRFDFLQPCPLPANGCPPAGLGYLASHVVNEPGANGCCKNVRRWYWVTGLSLPDGDLIKNEDGTVDLDLPDVWRMPVLKKRGGCWFFETVSRSDVIGTGLLTYRDNEPEELYNQAAGASDTTTIVAVPGYADALAAAKVGSTIFGLFSGYATLNMGALANASIRLWINSTRVLLTSSNEGTNDTAPFGERAVPLLGPTVEIRQENILSSGASMTGLGSVVFQGFQYTPK